MEPDKKPTTHSDEIPEDATVVRQVQYAWVWSSMPWLAVVAVLLFTGIIPIDEITATVLTAIIVLPRYFNWRRTAYIVTSDTLIYQRGGIFKTNRYPIPLTKIKGARARYGRFGRVLGYQAVDIVMENDTVASLGYLPPLSGLAELLQKLIDEIQPAFPEREGSAESSDLSHSSDQEGLPGKTDED